MSPEKQRIAIAEACGWKMIRRDSQTELWSPPQWNGKAEKLEWTETLPDYLSDLNAMHEAEKVLDQIELKAIREYLPDPKAYNTYIDVLRDVVGGVPGCFAHCTATAAQRAEAFLRTIGKWEE